MAIFPITVYVEAKSPAHAVLAFLTGDREQMEFRVDDPSMSTIPDDISGLEDDGSDA